MIVNSRFGIDIQSLPSMATMGRLDVFAVADRSVR